MTVALTETGAHRAPLQFPWRLIKSSAMAHFSRPKFFRRGGRAVECAGLENRKAERPREFESHPLRHEKNIANVQDQIADEGMNLPKIRTQFDRPAWFAPTLKSEALIPEPKRSFG